MSGNSLSRHIPGNVDWIVELVSLSVALTWFCNAFWFEAVWTFVQQRPPARHLSWRVSKVKEDMKSGEISHQGAVCAVPVIKDRVDGIFQVAAWRVHCYRDRTLPPLEQRFKVIKECEISVGCVGYRLVALKLSLSFDVIVKHPIRPPQSLAELLIGVEAKCIR